MLESRTKNDRVKVGSVVATAEPKMDENVTQSGAKCDQNDPEATQRTPEGGFGDARGGWWDCRSPQDVQKPLKKVVFDEIVDSEGNKK